MRNKLNSEGIAEQGRVLNWAKIRGHTFMFFILLCLCFFLLFNVERHILQRIV